VQPDLFRPEMSTSATSATCGQTTCEATTSVTGSEDLEAGRSPCGLPDGQIDLFGLAVAPVSRSPSPALKRALLTSDISGMRGFGSSASVDLTRLLANKCRERLGSDGSIEFVQTWNRLTTPAGRWYWAHTASGRRTSASAFGGALKGWGTPTAQDAKHTGISPSELSRDPANLRIQAQLAAWPTPTQRDHKHANAASYQERSGTTKGEQLANLVVHSVGWATPRATDGEKMSGLSIARREAGRALDTLPEQARGAMPSGFPASTGKRGALNPIFSLWLMLGSGDLARAWASCAPPAMRSARRSPPSSSAP